MEVPVGEAVWSLPLYQLQARHTGLHTNFQTQAPVNKPSLET